MSDTATDETLPADDAPGGDYPALVPVSPEHYAMEQEIARGGMGRIRTARDRRLGRRIAIKEMLSTSRGAAARRFEREVRICARLEHPGIVSIHEAGTWPSGEPFFAMKLVRGRSLDEVIAATASLDDRIALLPTVIAVAEAVAYAHDQRVIHRDLKPKNVLVGRFGETVVIDWGLAKDLDGVAEPATEPEEEADPSLMPGSDLATDVREPAASDAPTEGGLTRVGSVMGTPAYMPPEQARGDEADERADVYAIGAILHHLLSGKPPVSGKSADETIQKILAGPLPSLASVQPGVPADLLAVVDKAMAQDPEQRYLDAGALADDLRRFQTGKLVGAHRYSFGELLRKWIARHRAAVAVGAIATIALVVVGIVAIRGIVREQERAEDQRVLAEQSRDEAEELVEFMLFELHDQLQPIGRLDLLGTVTTKAADYYEGRGDRGDPEEQHKHAIARVHIGDVLRAQGNLAGALEQYRAAAAIRDALEPRPEWQADRIVAHRSVSAVLVAQGDDAGGLAEARKALEIAEALVAAHPEPPWQRELASTHKKLGDTLKTQGDTAGALASYRDALAIHQRVVEATPEDEVAQRELAIAHDRVAQMLEAEGDGAGALTQLRAGLAIVDRLAALPTAGAVQRRDGWVFHNRVGDVLFEEDVAGALVEYRAALAIAEQLAADSPSNAQSQRDLSVSHEKLADALLATSDPAGALVEVRASLAIAKRLTTLDPTNAGWQRDLSISHDKVAQVLTALGDHAAALAEHRAGLAISMRLVELDPTNEDWKADLEDSRAKVAEAEAKLK